MVRVAGAHHVVAGAAHAARLTLGCGQRDARGVHWRAADAAPGCPGIAVSAAPDGPFCLCRGREGQQMGDCGPNIAMACGDMHREEVLLEHGYM